MGRDHSQGQNGQHAEPKEEALPGAVFRIDQPGDGERRGDGNHGQQGLHTEPNSKAGKHAADQENSAIEAVVQSAQHAADGEDKDQK